MNEPRANLPRDLLIIVALVLFAGVPERESAELAEGYPVRFVWEPLSAQELDALSQTRPEAQSITFEKKDCCPKQTLEVKVGGEYPLGAMEKSRGGN